MPTVVHVITRLELGGAQENTLSTCRGLVEAGYRVALLYGPGGVLDDELETMPGVAPCPIAPLARSVRPDRDVRAFTTTRAALARLRDDHRDAGGRDDDFIVHTHSSKAGIIGRTAAASLGIRNVVHSIHGFGFHVGQPAPLFRAYVEAERAMAPLTRAFIAVSRANVAEGQARGILRRDHRVEVVRSGMALERFFGARDRRDVCRAQLQIEPDLPLFVSIANLKPQKDPLTAVAAMRDVIREQPQAQLWYVGDGPLRTEVERFIATHGLTRSVRLLGWRRDVPDIVAASDVVVLSSRFEGLPRSAVQAVAAGRPFVGTRVDGTSEIIRCDRDGYLVEPGDPGSLAAAMMRAWHRRPRDPSPRDRLREWSVEVLVDRQDRLYRDLTSSPESSRPS